MLLILLLLILVPGLISLAIHKKLFANTITIVDFLMYYFIYTFCVFLIINFVLYLRNPHYVVNISLSENSDLQRVSFTSKFMAISLISSVMLPVLAYIARGVVGFLRKLIFLKRQPSGNFIDFDFQRQIKDFLFGNANFYLNLSEEVIRKLVLFIKKSNSRSGKLYFFSPDFDYSVVNSQLKIEQINSENIDKSVISQNDSLLVIGNMPQNDLSRRIESEFDQKNILYILFSENKLKNKDSDSVILPKSFKGDDSNYEIIEAIMMQSILDYVLRIV